MARREIHAVGAVTACIDVAEHESECARWHGFADSDRGASADLRVLRSRGRSVGYVVSWAWRSGGPAWSRTHVASFASEPEALAFASVKWAVLMAWLGANRAACAEVA